RLLQRAVARILEAVFEADFLDCSYGFRPGRNPHHALQALRLHIVTKKVSYVHEADIRSYFTRIDHRWLYKMVAHRIADPVILRLIAKWLKAGVMQDGAFIDAKEGVPQGGPISPVLSNLYLHFTLDLWFAKKIKPQARGEAYLVRFADDFVGCFQYREDADRYQRQLRERFARFNLELAEDKTRLLAFGRFAAPPQGDWRAKRPETFEFLGFKHVCGKARNGRFAVIRLPSLKSRRKFLAQTHQWLTEHWHWRRREQQEHLSMQLHGFYQYFGLHPCEGHLNAVRREVQRQWKHRLQSQGQRRKWSWKRLRGRPSFDLHFGSVVPPTREHGRLRRTSFGEPGAGCVRRSWYELASASLARPKPSKQDGSETCGRHGNVASEAWVAVGWGVGLTPEIGLLRRLSWRPHQRRQHIGSRQARGQVLR